MAVSKTKKMKILMIFSCFWVLLYGAVKFNIRQLSHIASEISRTGIETSEQKEIINNLILNNREKCQAIPFIEYINYEGCDKVSIQNLLCFGSCYVKPKYFVNEKLASLNIFGSCQPVKLFPRLIYLNCSDGKKKKFITHNITSECSCAD
nr:cerberus [Hydra vulgaris]